MKLRESLPGLTYLKTGLLWECLRYFKFLAKSDWLKIETLVLERELVEVLIFQRMMMNQRNTFKGGWLIMQNRMDILAGSQRRASDVLSADKVREPL